jgi:hypothetical protein
MTESRLKVRFEHRAWQIPSEARALEGVVEGAPIESMRNDAIERARRERASWQPDTEAWQQLIELHAFIGKRIRIQFFDPGTMYMLNEDEWPHPVEGDCLGIVTLCDDRHLQPFLLLGNPSERPVGGSSGLSRLRSRNSFSYRLAPVADIYEVQRLGEAQ